MVAIGIVWGWIFNANLGFVNSFLRLAGLPEPKWLLEPTGVFFGFGPSLALVTIVFVTVWYYVGFHAVIFLAGLTNIPPEYEEAAIIDGASGWQVFRTITVPLLSPTTYMLAIISTIGSFQSFTLIYVMAGMGWSGFGASRGEPLGTTQVITLFIFDTFYRLFKTGYGAAIATILFVIILILTLINMFVTRRRVFYIGG
jgi:ABC-type sugar transport system permease subunit